MERQQDLDGRALEAAADALVIIDERGRIQRFNRRAEEMFGYAKQDVIGHNVSLLMPEHDGSWHDTYIHRYLATGKSRIIGSGRNVVGRTRDGRLVPMWLQIGEMRAPDGARYFIGSLRDITLHQDLQSRLRLNSTHYHAIQLLARIGHWTWFPSSDGTWGSGRSEYSPEAAAIIGVLPSELEISVKDYIARFVYPDDRAYVTDLFSGAYNDRGNFYKGRYRIVRPDGVLRHVQEIGRNVLDGQERVSFTHGVIQDVTEQVDLEESLRASEASLRRDHQMVRLGHWTMKYGADGRWENAITTDWPEFNEIVGLPATGPAQTVGEFVDRRIHPDDRESYRMAFERLSDPKVGAYVSGHRIQRPDGSIIFVHEIGECIFDSAGRPVSASGVTQDITEYKRMEESLRASESRLREAQQIADLGSWDMDMRTFTVRMSEEHYRIFEHDPSLGPPDTDQFLEYVHPEDRDRVGHMLNAEFLGHFEPETFFRLVMKDGRIKHVVERKRMIFGENGKPVRIVGTTQDITESKRSEEILIQSKFEAEAANRAKSDFLSHMTHELRTPLNAVIGFADLVLQGIAGPLTGKQVEYLRDIERAGRHLLDTVNDVLDLSKIQAGQRDLQEAPVNLVELVTICASFISLKAGEKHLNVTLDLPRELPLLRADPLALKKILTNLLSNAVKFTPERGTVVLAASVGKDGLYLSVTDTGIGIKPEDIDIVMQPFRQADNIYSRQHEGTGLGLPLARALVELHGGRLEIKSTPGRGTTVGVYLPAERLMNIDLDGGKTVNELQGR